MDKQMDRKKEGNRKKVQTSRRVEKQIGLQIDK
jgi:hypothetical protein